MGLKNVRRLLDSFAPESYTLFLDPDRDSLKLTGVVTIKGRKTGRPSQRIAFHQHGLTITKATIVKHDKKGDQTMEVTRINHQRSMDEVRLHTGTMVYPGAYTVELHFKGLISDDIHGVYPCRYEIDGVHKMLLATDLESHHAREVFPCIDEPAAKATFDLTLASPLHETAISNTPSKYQEEKDGKLHTTFETTPRMSTYLFCFVYGDMQYAETKTKDGVQVRVWATKAHTPAALEFSLDVAKRSIEFFNEYYGVPYPLAKCDLAALPDFSAAAMENWGLITFREPFLVAEPSTASQSSRELTTLVICHEMSHQWFGDLVTMKWWDDLWLNESFANVMEYVGADALFPSWHVWNTFAGQEGLAAFRRDSIAGVQAIRTDVHHPVEIGTLFDPSIVYAKGGRLINMLLNYIDKDDFRKGLRAYFEKHRYNNTTGDDLWVALGEASGTDVGSFMRPWLERSGFPVLHVEQIDTSLAIAQEHFLLDPVKADHDLVWPVPLLTDRKEVPDVLTTDQVTVTLKKDGYVRLNHGAAGHYIVHYVNPAHAKAIAALASAKKLSEAERLMLLSDSSMLARAGIQSFAATLDLLSHYGKEDSQAVWDIMALVIADCRRFIDEAPDMEDQLKAYIRELIESEYKRLGWEEDPKESSQDTKLRGTILALGVYAEHKDITAKGLALFEAYKKDPAVVPSELRSIVFGIPVRNNVAGAFDYLLALEEKTSNVDLKQELQGALTLTRQKAEIQQLLDRLTDSKKVRQHDVDHWFVFLLRNRYAQKQTWEWLNKSWGWIEKTFASDKSYDYFPRYAASALNTRAMMQAYKTFFEPKRDQAALKRNIEMGIEELENRIAWLERDIAAVHAFLRAGS